MSLLSQESILNGFVEFISLQLSLTVNKNLDLLYYDKSLKFFNTSNYLKDISNHIKDRTRGAYKTGFGYIFATALFC